LNIDPGALVVYYLNSAISFSRSVFFMGSIGSFLTYSSIRCISTAFFKLVDNITCNSLLIVFLSSFEMRSI